MLPSSRPRSRSWGAGPWTTPPRPDPRHGRSRSTTATYSPLVSESHGGDGDGDGGGMVQEEAAWADREEETRAEVEEVMDEQQSNSGDAAKGEATGDERVRILEREVAAAKATEMKMLESLIHQTKELEQAKIALEEAKLEVASLRGQGGRRGGGGGGGGAETSASSAQWSVMDLMFGGVDEEINGLRTRLRAAVQAEERSRKAAGDLTAALSAVTMEAKQVKAWLSDAQAELERANAEVDRLRAQLRAEEAELWATAEQLDAVTVEWKDAAAAWRSRERSLLARARAAEEEADAARRENAELADMSRALGDENGGLRRALEQAVEETNAANESLEVAAAESSRLRDDVAEKESALEALRQENEALKSSEAAARARAKELDGQLALAAARKAEPPPLEKPWRAGDMQGKLSAAFLDSGRVVAGARKERMFASLSNLAELKSAAAAATMDDYDYEFDHFDGGQYGDSEHAMKHKKRRSILKKFGDLFRRRSLYKSNLAPVMHY